MKHVRHWGNDPQVWPYPASAIRAHNAHIDAMQGTIDDLERQLRDKKNREVDVMQKTIDRLERQLEDGDFYTLPAAVITIKPDDERYPEYVARLERSGSRLCDGIDRDDRKWKREYPKGMTWFSWRDDDGNRNVECWLTDHDLVGATMLLDDTWALPYRDGDTADNLPPLPFGNDGCMGDAPVAAPIKDQYIRLHPDDIAALAAAIRR